jgi:hypothetical protein
MTSNSSLDISSTSTTNADPIIVFECSDLRRDMGLLLLKRKNDDKFELHLHNDYTCQAIAMVLEINDLGRMFDCLQDYFIEKQVEI